MQSGLCRGVVQNTVIQGTSLTASGRAHGKLPQIKYPVGEKRKAALEPDRPGFATAHSAMQQMLIQYLFCLNHYTWYCMTPGKSRNSARDRAFGDGEGANRACLFLEHRKGSPPSTSKPSPTKGLTKRVRTGVIVLRGLQTWKKILGSPLITAFWDLQ